VSVVSGKEVSACCKSFVKVNPNGVDLAPTEVHRLPSDLTIVLHGDKRGYIGPDGALTRDKSIITPDAEGFYNFEKGSLYELRFPEVSVPATCTGFAFPRSSINRLGVIKLESAVFDSGYQGEPTQVIMTPIAARIHHTEAVIQLVFLRNEKAADTLYSGFYQHEKRESQS
jgi:deoxycytidine triphosphate deaminase